MAPKLIAILLIAFVAAAASRPIKEAQVAVLSNLNPSACSSTAISDFS